MENYYNTTYDYTWDLVPEWKRLNRMLKWIRDKKGTIMLDIGCGVGNTTLWSARNGIKWMGIDSSQRAITIGKSYYEGNFILGNGEFLPFKNNELDFVVALGSIEHFDSPIKTIQEMYRVLKSSGYAVIVVPNRSMLEEWFYNGTEQPQELRMSKNKWKFLIEKESFKICQIKKDYGPRIFKNWKLRKILIRLGGKLTLFLPDCFTYQWIFNLTKSHRLTALS